MELERCPRCGGEIRVEEGVYGEVWEWHCVKCLVMSGYRFATEAEAIEDANRRVPSRTESEAVRLLCNVVLNAKSQERLDVTLGFVYLWLQGLELASGPHGKWDIDRDAYRKRYGEVET